MTVELLFFDGCPNHNRLLTHLRALLDQAGAPDEVELVQITSDEHAHAERFLGSPSVRVDGGDVEPDAAQRSDFGMHCRLYLSAEGLSGVPSDPWILGALTTRVTQGDGRPDRSAPPG